MIVAATSLFRSAAHLIGQYADRMAALRVALEARGDELRLVLVEGDSIDRTRALLEAQRRPGDVVIEANHYGPHYGSVVAAERFWQLAYAGNAALASPALLDADVWLFVECDLRWTPIAMMRLIDRTRDAAVVAPLIITAGGWFYDTWGFRTTDDAPFNAWPPYVDGMPIDVEAWPDLVPVESAGSVLAVRGEVARACRFSPTEAIVGLCRDVRSKGGEVVVDPRVTVVHP